MRHKTSIAIAFIIGSEALVAGCSGPSATTSSTSATTPASAGGAVADATPARGRAEIWADNCIRCHNSRQPDSYSDAEWDLVMQQMRVRGYLTGQEQRAVAEFLKAAN
jgi:hypothetical protein